MKRMLLLGMTALLISMPLHQSKAQSNIGLNALGGKIGFVDPEDIGSTIGLGAEADLGTLIPELYLGAFLDFWSKSEGSVSFSEIVFGPEVRYYLQMNNSAFKPYVGGGVGFAISRVKVDIPAFDTGFGTIGGGSSSDTNLDFAVRFLVGADYPLTEKLTGFAHLLYHIDGANYLGLFVGIMFPLGK